ncbi:hypothetical protein SEA_BRUHMOMENT_92 [Arthrobacter phage BruhMoment]|nr:hypothetical protein SEA_BRUHMOMENT_92 [Arthrobacter phage BruhMoment]
MISYEEAQELHLLFGGPVEARLEGYAGELDVSAVMVSVKELERARELVGAIVSDLDPDGEGVEPPTPEISYDPCIKGTIEIGGVTSEFMILLANDSVQYSQWGASNTALWPRVDLIQGMHAAATDWADENLCRTCKERLLDDGEGYDGECGDCADKREGENDDNE